jgi:hypothetical protein
MAVLATSGLSAIPNNIATGIWQKATTGSTVGQLSGSEPQKFGSTNVMTLTGLPRAEYVAEGAQKGSSSATFGTKTITPHKAQVTIRANEEVKWADEDYQLDVLNELGIALGGALARALDLGVYHAINPLTGTAAASITSKITDTTKSVEVAGSADTEVEAAAGLVIAAGFTPSGIALDPKYAWTLATARYPDGRKKFPDLGFGTNITTSRASTRPCRPRSAARRRRRTPPSAASSVTSPRSGGVCSGRSRSPRSSTATPTVRAT